MRDGRERMQFMQQQQSDEAAFVKRVNARDGEKKFRIRESATLVISSCEWSDSLAFGEPSRVYIPEIVT